MSVRTSSRWTNIKFFYLKSPSAIFEGADEAALDWSKVTGVMAEPSESRISSSAKLRRILFPGDGFD
jgi:hypothetical protein